LASGRQKRTAIQARRAKRRTAADLEKAPRLLQRLTAGTAPVDKAKLAPANSYGEPEFARRGFYVDMAFACENCGREQVWTATQQKWWYEVAKGFIYSTAKLCRACRALVRAKKEQSRRTQLEGLARKQAARRKA
jgi:hypothetical protein